MTKSESSGFIYSDRFFVESKMVLEQLLKAGEAEGALGLYETKISMWHRTVFLKSVPFFKSKIEGECNEKFKLDYAGTFKTLARAVTHEEVERLRAGRPQKSKRRSIGRKSGEKNSTVQKQRGGGAKVERVPPKVLEDEKSEEFELRPSFGKGANADDGTLAELRDEVRQVRRSQETMMRVMLFLAALCSVMGMMNAYFLLTTRNFI